MGEKYFHFDTFEMFGKTYHRAVVLYADDIMSDFNFQLKSNGIKLEGLFYKKLCLFLLDSPDFSNIQIFDVDAEKDACIIAHSSLIELLSITNKMQSIFQEKDLSKELLKSISAYTEQKDDDAFDLGI